MNLDRCCLHRTDDMNITAQCCGTCHYEDGYYGIPLINMRMGAALRYRVCCKVFKELRTR